MTLFAKVNVEALVMAAIILSITLGITYWASKRASTAVGFYAAGRQITGRQNGLAISGDYLSAASFLGIAGLIYLYGFDGFLYSIGFLVAFLTVMFLLAERMRNAGKYTIADVLSFRLNETPARAAAALGTFAVVTFYLIAQMVGAGVLIEKLVGIDFSLAVHRHRRVHALLRRLRRHGGHDLGADRQGRAADDRHPRDVDLRARQGRLQPDRALQPRRGEHDRGVDVLARARHLSAEAAGHRLARPGARARHGRPAAHPDALLHRPDGQGRALVRGLGDVHHRVLLPADHLHRVRRARLSGRRRG